MDNSAAVWCAIAVLLFVVIVQGHMLQEARMHIGVIEQYLIVGDESPQTPEHPND